jgi:hypothetical protein
VFNFADWLFDSEMRFFGVTLLAIFSAIGFVIAVHNFEKEPAPAKVVGIWEYSDKSDYAGFFCSNDGGFEGSVQLNTNKAGLSFWDTRFDDRDTGSFDDEYKAEVYVEKRATERADCR